VPLLSRFYNSSADALETVRELKKRGLRDAAAHIIDNSAGYVGETTLVRRGVPQKKAKAYAAMIREGKTLLLVDAPFMGTAIATEIMDKGADAQSTYEGGEWQEGAPFSSMLAMPVLINNPAPFSSFWGLPVISKRKKAPDYGRPLRKPTLHSSMFGPLLTKKQAPTFGSVSKGGRPTNFGLPLLTKKGKPIGFGVPLIIRKG
jgi:hypothetical protein